MMIDRLLYILTTIVVVGLFFVSYLLIKPYELVSQQSLSVSPEVVTSDVQFVKLKGQNCVNYTVPVTIEVYIAQVGSAIKILKAESHLVKGCKTTTTPLATSVIPDYVANGEYVLRFELTAQVNPFRQVKQTISSNIFELKR